MTLLILYLCIAIGVSFMCSILEAVLLSVTPSFVETEIQRRPRRAHTLKQVRESMDESISSILILNTFAHTMGAAGVGAQAVKQFGTQYESLIAFLLTLAILYFSEIIPKTLGATFWKQLALPSAYVITLLVKLLFPFVWVSAKLTGLFSGRAHSSAISREELSALARLGARDGALKNQESQLLENILTLRDTRTEAILTPRSVVSALESSVSVTRAVELLREDPFTRIPMYSGDIDNIVGIAFKPTLLAAERDGMGDTPVSEFALTATRVSREVPVLQLLDMFIAKRSHMFVVEDKYGQTAGIVTLEDAIETLLGREIMDESDEVEDMQQLAKTKYRQRLRQEREPELITGDGTASQDPAD